MAVQVERWVGYIMNRFWKENTFLKNAFNDDQYVIGGKIVHIPQPGAKPVVVKNRNSFPAVTVQRIDTDIVYVLDKYTSDPTHIENADQQEISYDKIGSVFSDHAGQLAETVGDDMIIKWLTGLAAGNIKRTTGAAAAPPAGSGIVGNRLVVTVADVKKMRTYMNSANVPKEGRFAMLESNMMDQFTDGLSINQDREFSEHYDAKEGVVGRLFGFDFYERSSVAVASAGLNINPLGAEVQGTDHLVSLFWQKDAVTRALGQKKFFERKDDPENYGDIYSALLRAGGRRRRADDAGVYALIQTT